MKKIIRVIVGPKGETKVETKGFSGGECREASRFIEQALGQPVERAAHGRVLPGAAGRPADPAVAVTSASFPLRGDTRCATPAIRPMTSR